MDNENRNSGRDSLKNGTTKKSSGNLGDWMGLEPEDTAVLPDPAQPDPLPPDRDLAARMGLEQDAAPLSQHPEDISFLSKRKTCLLPKDIPIPKNAPRLWMLDPEQYPRALESFRSLKNSITRLGEKEGMKVFLLTGSDRKCGTSAIAFNLSLICAWDMPDRRILMTDANLSHPSLHKSFGISPEPGFADFLYGKVPMPEIIRQSCLPNLDLVTFRKNGKSIPSPFSLGSFSEFLQTVKTHYDFIFLDSEPVLSSGHTQLVSSRADGVILVTEASRTRLEVITELKNRLESSGARLAGSFLNRRRYVIPKWIYRYI
ncbi:MAG: CpsD/CapB family tyrosine-protein kinase [Desulfobacterales bacterium]